MRIELNTTLGSLHPKFWVQCYINTLKFSNLCNISHIFIIFFGIVFGAALTLIAADRAKLRERGVSVQALQGAIASANQAMPSGSVVNPSPAAGEPGMLSVETGEFLQNAKDVGDIVVGVSNGRPIYLREVARVEAGAQLPQRYVWFTPGVADAAHAAQQGQNHPAVTITVTKKPGENAVDVARGAGVAAWVAGSVLVLALPASWTTAGIAGIVVLALIVADLAILEYLGLRKMSAAN